MWSCDQELERDLAQVRMLEMLFGHTLFSVSPVSGPHFGEGRGNGAMTKEAEEMADIHKFSEQVIDLAERLEDVADAAKGKGSRRGSFGTRWLLLPVAGAGLYALATNGSFTRQAKDVMDQAKTRASELPDDLLGRIRQTPQKSTGRTGGQSRSRTSSARNASRARKPSSAR
jgi:hypothetical protein